MTTPKARPSPVHHEAIVPERGLILFNDHVNTFDFVIESLVEVCSHAPEQAEQCALIAHFKGKCNVKTGDFYTVKPMFDELTLRGLTVSIE